MGNCIALSCVKLRALEKSTKSAIMVDSANEQGNEPLLHDLTSPTKTSLQVGEVLKVTCLEELENLLVSSKIVYSSKAGAKKVKVVVTREQFKLLLADAKKMQSRHGLLSKMAGNEHPSHQPTGPRRGCRKWRPMLSAISEEQDF